MKNLILWQPYVADFKTGFLQGLVSQIEDFLRPLWFKFMTYTNYEK